MFRTNHLTNGYRVSSVQPAVKERAREQQEESVNKKKKRKNKREKKEEAGEQCKLQSYSTVDSKITYTFAQWPVLLGSDRQCCRSNSRSIFLTLLLLCICVYGNNKNKTSGQHELHGTIAGHWWGRRKANEYTHTYRHTHTHWHADNLGSAVSPEFKNV